VALQFKNDIITHGLQFSHDTPPAFCACSAESNSMILLPSSGQSAL
jgi:hypothetical protein